MRKLILEPHIGIGKVKLGMSRKAVHEVMGMKSGQPVSGSNVPPQIPAGVSFEMDLDREIQRTYVLKMRSGRRM